GSVVAVLRGAVEARDGEFHRHLLLWLQRNLILAVARGNSLRRGMKADVSVTNEIVEPTIAQEREVTVCRSLEAVAFVLAVGAANFKKIGEVGVESDDELELYRLEAVVRNVQLFVAGVSPENFGAREVQSPTGDGDVLLDAEVDVSQIGGEETVVL